MNDKLKLAAQRLRQWSKVCDTNDRHTHPYADKDDGSALLSADESIMVDWAVDLLDDTKLTINILKSYRWHYLINAYYRHDIPFGLMQTFDGFDVISKDDNSRLDTIVTIGDLRCLLASFKVDL